MAGFRRRDRSIQTLSAGLIGCISAEREVWECQDSLPVLGVEPHEGP